MRVLIVDDSKTMRSIIRMILANQGITAIEEACDGADAMSKAGGFKPDLILLDWNMPTMNGIEFLREYRTQGNETPVIMVTTESEKPRVLEAIKAGVNSYVVKPFTPETLVAHINNTLAKCNAA